MTVFQDVLETAEDRKLRGGYYTPGNVASLLSSWAVAKGARLVLEPSFGDGNFLIACFEKLRAKGLSKSKAATAFWGTEISHAAYEIARARLSTIGSTNGNPINLSRGDFFEWFLSHRTMSFDAVVGNPPFIRYQNFPEPSRSIAMSIMSSAGLKANGLTNIWVPFVVASTLLLKPTGRLAMVIPAELLQVSYAAQLRTFLVSNFSRIVVITCNRLLFPGTEQEVLLLLGEKRGTAQSAIDSLPSIEVIESGSEEDLVEILRSIESHVPASKIIDHESEKWTKYFLDAVEIGLMRELKRNKAISPLSRFASVDVGIVTGENSYFILSLSQAEEYGISDYTTPIVCRSQQLLGANFTKSDYKKLLLHDKKVLLLDLKGKDLRQAPIGLKKFLDEGIRKGIPKGYKCSIRSNWFEIPSVWIPDAFMLRQIHDYPKFINNTSRAVSTDTIHRVKLNIDREILLSSYYTSLTAASAEIQGRSYGGGVLELEPSEAEELLLPAKPTIGLSGSEIDELLRSDQLSLILEKNDDLILHNIIGLARADCIRLRKIWTKLRDRRNHRK